ncbi:unnamed protein product, partial [Aphanomyces euteiches]
LIPMTKLPVELIATFGVGLGIGVLLHKYALRKSEPLTTTVNNEQDEVRRLIRPNILQLTPYRCARDDYSEGTLLDANENSLGPPLDDDHELKGQNLERYPSPYQVELKNAVATLRQRGDTKLESKHVFLGVGSDEVIDLMIRVACTPRVASILITPPTYGMYSVSADIHDVNIVKSPLVIDHNILATVTPQTKIIFLCSPGNPTANLLRVADIERILTSEFKGFVVVDEAYIDFTDSDESSLAPLVTKYRRLVVTQTLSKGFGLAGIRLGIAFADPTLIQILSNVKAPYNINKLSSKVALDALANVSRLHANVRVILDERKKVIAALQASPYVKTVYATDSNFVLFECDNAFAVYKKMAENGVVIRYRGNQLLLDNCLRATIGSPEENQRMLSMFASVSAEFKKMSKHGKKDKKHDKHEKHEKKRKHKKDDKKEKLSKKHKSSVSSEEVERAMDLKSALQHVESMIKEFPDLANDLRGIFQIVDAGEVVVIGGIENQEMKNRLASMFPLMGLVESGPNQSFSKHKVAKHISLIEKFGGALSPPPAQPARAPTPKPRAQPIGPQMPPRAPPVEQDEDDVAVGPALPGMRGYREASADVEERMRRQAEAEEALQWKKLRGEADDTSKPAVVQREEWMLSLPNDESIQAALGGAPRKFRARDKDERDDTWFAAPADREQAMREKAQMYEVRYDILTVFI